jgi:hypothetical protein
VVDLAFDRYGNMGLSVAYGAESWERQNGGDWLTARHGGEATVTRGGSNTFGDGSFTVQFSSDGKAVREFYVAVPTHVLHMQDPKWSTLCVPYDCIDLKESHSYISGFDTKQECVARCVRPPNDVNYGPLGCQPALDTCWVPPPNHHH